MGVGEDAVTNLNSTTIWLFGCQEIECAKSQLGNNSQLNWVDHMIKFSTRLLFGGDFCVLLQDQTGFGRPHANGQGWPRGGYIWTVSIEVALDEELAW